MNENKTKTSTTEIVSMSKNSFEETKTETINNEPAAEIRGSEETILVREEEEIAHDGEPRNQRKLYTWLAVAAAVLVVGILALWWVKTRQTEESVTVTIAADEKKEGGKGESNEEVKLDPETLHSAGIQTEGVTQRPAVALLKTTGSIETNPQQTQTVSPLVAGRVESMNVRVGEYVRQGDVLATISSPQLAELQGKAREARIRLDNAGRSLARAQSAENRAAILQAKAKLDEAQTTLTRTKRLIELGAGAGKDLVSAEANYKTAKADFDFQSNIPLNKEIQEARAEVETAKVDLAQTRDQLRALGASPVEVGSAANISQIAVRAPAAGMVTERPVNPGAGVEAGTTLFVLSNLSSVFVIASVPQTQMSLIHIGTAAQVTSPALGEGAISARVAYIDPQLNEETRAGRVRLEMPNPNGRLRAGMFVEVGFQTGTGSATGEELVVPTSAVQRMGEKTVVFVPEAGEPGSFKAREVETGGEIEGYTRIKSGLELGEMVVTKGSFTLKAQLQKGELGDE